MRQKLEIELKGRSDFGGIIQPANVNEAYPSFHFYYDEPREFPEKGTMLIKYCVRRSDKDNNRPEDTRFSCTIDVKEIVSAEGEKDESPTHKYDEAGAALDKLAAEKENEEE